MSGTAATMDNSRNAREGVRRNWPTGADDGRPSNHDNNRR